MVTPTTSVPHAEALQVTELAASDGAAAMSGTRMTWSSRGSLALSIVLILTGCGGDYRGREPGRVR
jgi:hypothetical protein